LKILLCVTTHSFRPFSFLVPNFREQNIGSKESSKKKIVEKISPKIKSQYGDMDLPCGRGTLLAETSLGSPFSALVMVSSVVSAVSIQK
jgi:hypothetical protein